jgi:hypothetical protein
MVIILPVYVELRYKSQRVAFENKEGKNIVVGFQDRYGGK